MSKVSGMKPYKKRKRPLKVSQRIKRQRQQYYKQHKSQINKKAKEWRRKHKSRIEKYQ